MDVAGRWSGTWTNLAPDEQSGPFSLAVVQVGADITATAILAGNACFAEGSLGGLVEGTAVAMRNAGRDEVEFTGSISGTTMSGTFSMACGNASGTWILERTDRPGS